MTSMNCRPPREIAPSSEAMLPAANSRMRNSPRLNIGSFTLVSMKQKSARSATPRIRPPNTIGLPQPVGSLWYGRMPKVIAVSRMPAPAAKVRLPSQSMRALRVLAISLSDL